MNPTACEDPPSSDMVDNSAAFQVGTNYKCIECPATFNQIQSVKCHMTEAHGIMRPGQCKICKILFANREESKAHQLQQHWLQCSVCDKAFQKLNFLEKHMKNVHSTPIEYPCRICGVIEFTKAWHVKHLEIHHQSPETGTLVFRCDLCFAPFFDAAELQSHARIHDDPTECPFCHQLFPRSNAMKRHKRLVHPVEMRKERKDAMRQLSAEELEKLNEKREQKLAQKEKSKLSKRRRARQRNRERKRLMKSNQVDS